MSALPDLPLLVWYLPLGVLGLWRWGVWLLKVFLGAFYVPETTPVDAAVSVVTPVYNERPDVFAAALASWRANAPTEILAVIDHTDHRSIEIFQEFSRSFAGAVLVVTEVPGKRPALARGIRAARGDIVALVDSDTVWESGVLRAGLSPFRDPSVGGVATRQNVLAPKTLAQRLFDVQLDQRYDDEMPFLGVTGNIFRCLSGRTAFYRRSAVLPLLSDLEHETFWGTPVISGDDKRLTYLVQAAGWRTAYQATARVWTPGMERLPAFWKQRVRWARNSWRADLRVLGERWVWRHPLFVGHLLDTFVQPFVLLASPLYFVASLSVGLWGPALALLLWWHATRCIKFSPHFARRPQDLVLLPLLILFSFLSAGIRIYALFSLNTQGWITRWDPARLPAIRLLQRVVPLVATLAVVGGLAAGIVLHRERVLEARAVASHAGPSP